MSDTISTSRLEAGASVFARVTAGWRRLTVAERNYAWAFLLCAAVVAVFNLAFHVERNVFKIHPTDSRFVGEATEAAMRYITIPHIIIGFLFLVSSRANQTPRKRAWVVLLLIAGAALCGIYHIGGAKTNYLLMASVYLYFLVHELRDEAMFYQALGETPPIPDRRAFSQMVSFEIAVLVGLTASIGWVGAPLGLYRNRVDADLFAGWSIPLRVVVAFGPLLAASLIAHVGLRYHAARLGFADLWAMLRTHAPLFRMMTGVVGILALSMLLTKRPYSLILFHVMAWYVFASYRLRVQSARAQGPKGSGEKSASQEAPNAMTLKPSNPQTLSLWTWMRTTFAGFQVLHVGMVAALMAFGFFWTYGLGQPAYLDWLLRPDSFLYWTIMHITVSFVPR